MSATFDVEALRSNIGGNDREMERELLAAFIESTGESLALLKRDFPGAASDSYNAAWRHHMHQIKGAALNVCAGDLAQIAKTGQDQSAVDLPIKQALLASVLEEFSRVRQRIRQIYPDMP